MINEKDHIHTWNKYNKNGHLCCSTCDMTHTKYMHQLANEE